MILVIDLCKENLHSYEFVNPIGDILIKNDLEFFTKKYLDVSGEDILKSDKIIICGTSLGDFEYINNLDKFSWIRNYENPILGICAGMQIIGLIFGGSQKQKTEIGYFHEKFKNGFLGLGESEEVYHLHNSYVDFSNLNFEIFSFCEINQAVKHKEKQIYATLFHPEIRNKDMVVEFCKLENNK